MRDNPNTWGCYSVLNVLYSLIQRSQINEQLAAIKRNEDPTTVAGEYGTRPLYRMLGYFSIIGLLRVHCLLGDFSLALKTLDDIELNKKAMFARVMAAHFTTYYYVGFSYMMMRRYADAIRMFSHILVYVSRTKNFQKNASFDSMAKQNDQMYALIAICVAFQPTRLDDTIHTALREKYGEQFLRMQRGGPESLPLFEELFRAACPKFIAPTPPDFDNRDLNIDPLEHHLAIFMDEVRTNMWSPTVKSYLKLYTTMDLKKLAGFLETDPEQLRGWLLVNKQRSRQMRWSEGGLLDGDVVGSGDLDYAMQGVSLVPCLALRFRENVIANKASATAGSDPHLRGQGWTPAGGLVSPQPRPDVLKALSSTGSLAHITRKLLRPPLKISQLLLPPRPLHLLNHTSTPSLLPIYVGLLSEQALTLGTWLRRRGVFSPRRLVRAWRERATKDHDGYASKRH